MLLFLVSRFLLFPLSEPLLAILPSSRFSLSLSLSLSLSQHGSSTLDVPTASSYRAKLKDLHEEAQVVHGSWILMKSPARDGSSFVFLPVLPAFLFLFFLILFSRIHVRLLVLFALIYALYVLLDIRRKIRQPASFRNCSASVRLATELVNSCSVFEASKF